ncbi:hypothetical protein B0F88_10374 [Methylobacter tundripaludum]|uniref:Helix-turn-helix domain-containing protein n=1 Tax=Methylobacter tundripaludum TaxID=173365 RepID=A0A2S6H5D7_9GAMM|nr:hypothetical protein [Methylobacter tundripaludum]PPK72641.1 hypothetical protein B0F88_10374 [Methylobacter tundripaludum]
MSKVITAPIDPETEVTREDIAKMAGCSLAKVGFVTIRDKWGFPKPSRPGPKGKLIYPRLAVLEWLRLNNLKSMVFVAADRAPVGTYKQPMARLDSSAISKIHIGIRPAHKFTGTGKSKRVHVPVRNECEPQQLRPELSRFSNSISEYPIAVSY